MTVVKMLGRILLILLITVAVFQLIMTVIAMAAIASQHPEGLSYMIGRLVGSLLLLTLFVWLFRKLGA